MSNTKYQINLVSIVAHTRDTETTYEKTQNIFIDHLSNCVIQTITEGDDLIIML